MAVVLQSTFVVMIYYYIIGLQKQAFRDYYSRFAGADPFLNACIREKSAGDATDDHDFTAVRRFDDGRAARGGVAA